MKRKGTTPYVILGILSGGPKSGYDIRKVIEERIGHFWRESFGQIYPALATLCEDGLAVRTAKPNGARERFEYRITPAGRAALREWLALPAAEGVPRNELLLKLFLGAEGGPAALTPIIERAAVKARDDAAAYAALARELSRLYQDDHDLPYVLMTLRHGVLIAEARARWADEVSVALRRLGRASHPARAMATRG